jgi:hypothetical protein
MSMVARYKKNGGFVQLLQVMETCGQKKYEQFIAIIAAEDPNWAQAIKDKMITFDRIINWDNATLMEVLAQVNTLAFGSALKSLPDEKLIFFIEKLSPQDKRKLELQMSDINPTTNESNSAVTKVISETRGLITTGVLKVEKIDPRLAIPENFEDKLSSGPIDFNSPEGLSNEVGPASIGPSATAVSAAFEIDKLQKKLTLVTKELQSLKQENIVMKDKLDKIKRIA